MNQTKGTLPFFKGYTGFVFMSPSRAVIIRANSLLSWPSSVPTNLTTRSMQTYKSIPFNFTTKSQTRYHLTHSTHTISLLLLSPSPTIYIRQYTSLFHSNSPTTFHFFLRQHT